MTQITQILYALALAGITAGATALTAYLKAHFSAKTIDTAKTIAKAGVNFAEQTAAATNYGPKGKFDAALAKAESLAARYGIKLTPAQWETLIEDAVGAMKRAVDAATPEAPIVH